MSKSVMVHQFSQVPRAEIPRSQFDRSHGVKTTFDAGYLVPFYVDEALPGDTFNLRMTGFARLATPIYPVMDNMFLDTFFFAVPMRLIWDNWQRFNGEQDDPGDSTDFLVPTMTSPGGGYQANTLSDYFGIPTEVAGLVHNSVWHRAYNLIYNEWFRDQNLQDSVVVDKDDGPDAPTDYVLLRRGKRHDYFTSALPWPQKGPTVELPLGDYANVKGIGIVQNGASGAIANVKVTGPELDSWSNAWYTVGPEVPGGSQTYTIIRESGTDAGYPNIYADLQDATASTINQLRQAFQIQRLYERDARGGTRYTEIIRAHFGVISPDARLQRPEYLGGGSSPVNIHPVAQTSESATTPQGTLSAFGTAVTSGHGFSKSFTEHCLIIGLANARADLSYQQGLNRMFSRQTRFDFYWPALSHIGEQQISNKEIYAVGSAVPGQDDEPFGYQERYAEYRYKPSIITGEFRSNFAQSLDAWHLAQDFGALPVLNDSFIVDDPPIDRVIAVNTEPHFIMDVYIKLKCARPMPVYGVPGLIDHF